MHKYQENAYLRSIKTVVANKGVVAKKPAVSFVDNIVYPGGGGQPPDKATMVLSGGQVVSISRIAKINKETFCALETDVDVDYGDNVEVLVDWNRRFAHMRCHTAAHILMGAARRAMSNYSPEGIEIADGGTGCSIRFTGEWCARESDARAIVAAAAEVIGQNRSVITRVFGTLEEAITAYSDIYRGPMTMPGPVSIVVIDGWDANPCGGTHLGSSSEVGSIILTRWDKGSLDFVVSA